METMSTWAKGRVTEVGMTGAADAAVDQPVDGFQNEMAYAGLVYGKGAFAYERIREVIGDRQFFAGVQRYVGRNRFAVAPPRALFDELARGRHRARVRRLERRWLDETHGDEDLGQADMGQMTADWLGGGQTVGNLQNLLQQMTQGLGGGAIPGLGGPVPGGGAPTGPNNSTGLGGADSNQALQDAAQLLRNLR